MVRERGSWPTRLQVCPRSPEKVLPHEAYCRISQVNQNLSINAREWSQPDAKLAPCRKVGPKFPLIGYGCRPQQVLHASSSDDLGRSKQAAVPSPDLLGDTEALKIRNATEATFLSRICTCLGPGAANRMTVVCFCRTGRRGVERLS